mgnify:CR=1 FL=1
MTKFRKLSTIFLSTVVASVMAPQVAFAQKSAQDHFNQATEKGSETGTNSSLPPSSEMGYILGDTFCKSFSELANIKNVSSEKYKETLENFSVEALSILSSRYEAEKILTLKNKIKKIDSQNTSTFINSIIDDPYFFSALQRFVQVFSKDKECLKAFFKTIQVTEENTKKQKAKENYLDQGKTHYEQEELNKALEDLNQAIEQNPDSVEAYVIRAFIYDKQGKLEQALEDLNQVIELNPDSAEAYAARGLVYKKQGNRNKAIKDLEKAKTLYQKQGKTETKEYQEVQQKLDKLRQ